MKFIEQVGIYVLPSKSPRNLLLQLVQYNSSILIIAAEEQDQKERACFQPHTIATLPHSQLTQASKTASKN
ncbi:MAG: hypothetical protein DRJ97_06350 [Thermoprotei archaeon]|nr:MAG: hypothetical protein DRJ97_06350 [Thermoprotei archaeon]